VTSYGALAKRSGSRKMSQELAAGKSVRGVIQWDDPISGGKQIVAICDGDLWYKNAQDFTTTFTQVNPTPAISDAGPVDFAVFRDTSASAALVLYFCDAGGQYWKWTGAVLSDIDSDVSPLVPQGLMLRSYHTRVFCVDQRYRKHLWWSKVGTGADYDTGAATDGGSAIVDTLSGETLQAMETLGSSLLLATDDSISRFTGYSNEDIRLDQDGEGVSDTIGTVSRLGFRKAEDFVACVSDRGVYAVSESQARAISMKIEPSIDSESANFGAAVVGYHRGRRELWVSFDDAVYVYSTRLQAWVGPWSYSFGITDMARYEDSTGAEWLMAGCDDGFVRHMDTGSKDNVAAAGTGGDAITMTIEFPPIFFESGPVTRKQLDRLMLQADIPASAALVVKHGFDNEALTSETALTGTGGVIQTKRVDLNNQGTRLKMQLVDASVEIPIIYGFVLHGYDMLRPYV
jgi:hypothetical protein